MDLFETLTNGGKGFVAIKTNYPSTRHFPHTEQSEFPKLLSRSIMLAHFTTSKAAANVRAGFTIRFRR